MLVPPALLAPTLLLAQTTAQQVPSYWLWSAILLLVTTLGFITVWLGTQATRRAAREQAKELIEVARRQALVTVEEERQKVEKDLMERRAEANREFDRRDIEMDVRLRAIRSHEESIALLDHQLQHRQERLTREDNAIRQARDAIRSLSKSLRKRLEGVSQMDADEIKLALREEVQIECQDELRALRRQILERSEQDLQAEAKRILVTTRPSSLSPAKTSKAASSGAKAVTSKPSKRPQASPSSLMNRRRRSSFPPSTLCAAKWPAPHSMHW
jgi:ribonucrease Y